jgi:DNA replication protein DnaC
MWTWGPTESTWTLLRAQNLAPEEKELARRIVSRRTGESQIADRHVVSEIMTNVLFRRQQREDAMAGVPAMYAGGFQALLRHAHTYGSDQNRSELRKAIETLTNWTAEILLGKHARHGWFISGQQGNGKTGLARGVEAELAAGGQWLSVEFWTAREMFDTIISSYRDGVFDQVINQICSARLLVIDDLGAGQLSENNIGNLFRIVNHRTESRMPIIVTSNFRLDELAKSNTSTGRRIADRLRDIVVEINLIGGSMRGHADRYSGPE